MTSELLLSLGTHDQTVEALNPSESIKLCYFSIIKKHVCGNLYYQRLFKAVPGKHTQNYPKLKKKK